MFTLNVSFLDGDNKPCNMTYYVRIFADPSGTELQHQYITLDYFDKAASILFVNLKNMLDGHSFNFTLKCAIDHTLFALDDNPRDFESDREEGARFTFVSVGDGGEGPLPYIQGVRTFKEDLVLLGSDVVDTSDSDVAAYVTGQLSGFGGVSGLVGQYRVLFADSRGWLVNAFTAAVEYFFSR